MLASCFFVIYPSPVPLLFLVVIVCCSCTTHDLLMFCLSYTSFSVLFLLSRWMMSTDVLQMMDHVCPRTRIRVFACLLLAAPCFQSVGQSLCKTDSLGGLLADDAKS